MLNETLRAETGMNGDFYRLLNEVPFGVAALKGPSLIIEYANKFILAAWQLSVNDIAGKPLFDAVPHISAAVQPIHSKVFETRQRFEAKEIYLADGDRYFNYAAEPIFDGHEEITGQLISVADVTDQVLARRKVAENETRLRHFTDSMPAIIWITAADGYCTYLNQHWYNYTGQTKEQAEGFGWLNAIHPDDKEATGKIFTEANTQHRAFSLLYRLRTKNGDYRWAKDTGSPRFTSDGNFEGFIGTVIDVHDEKLAAEKIRLSEERQAFLLKLSDALQLLTDAHKIKIEAMRILGEHLQISRCYYAEVDNDEEFCTIDNSYHNGIGSLDGVYRMNDFGKRRIAELKAGSITTTEDVVNDIFVNDAERQMNLAIDIHAYINVPLIKEGRLVGLLGINQSVPRKWSVLDFELVKETADRTWAAVEVAKAETAKRIADERYRTLFNSIDEGFCTIEVLFNEDGKPYDYRFLEVNPAFVQQTGLSNAEGHTMNDFAKIEDFWYETYGNVAVTGKAVRFENRAENLFRYYDVYAFKVGAPEERKVAVLFNDITQRKKAEVAITQSEKEFKEITEAIPQLVWVCNTEGEVIYFNENWYRFTGTGPEQSLGYKWANLLHPEDVAFTLELWNEAQRAATIVAIEYRLKTADGSYRWVFSKGVPIKDDNGNIEKWFGTCTDIHEQKIAEQALRESENRFRTLLQEAPVATCLFVGRELRIEVANDKIIAIMGKGPSVLGKPLAEAIPELVGQPFLKQLEKVFDTGETFESRNAPAKLLVDGVPTTFYVDYIFKPLKNAEGEVYAILDMTIDVTAHVLARKEVQESEARFRILAETLPQMIWVSDAAGNNEYASERWKQYAAIEDVWQAWAAMIHPDDKVHSERYYADAFKHGKSFKIEVRLKNKQGEYRWHNSVAEPVHDANGNIVKWVGALTDIHDQKAVEQKLEDLVAERTKELQRSNEDLQQFAHVASHDLKEPVRKIMVFAGRLENELKAHATEKAKLYFDKIQNASNRIYSMVEGVLAYSGVNNAVQLIEKVDLNIILKNVEADLELNIQESGAQIHYEHLPVISGASVLLHQLFFNLITNSIKFVRKNKTPVIDISCKMFSKEGKEWVSIVLKDNGIGFDNHDAEKIFQTFTRLNSKDSFEGTGLGLSLCKKIVERHDGTITARSEGHSGAVFLIELPVEQERWSV